MTLPTESATAVSLPSQPCKWGWWRHRGGGRAMWQSWQVTKAEGAKQPRTWMQQSECSRALSHSPPRCVAPLSAGRLGNTEVDCASWSQLSLVSREMTDQDQHLSWHELPKCHWPCVALCHHCLSSSEKKPLVLLSSGLGKWLLLCPGLWLMKICAAFVTRFSNPSAFPPSPFAIHTLCESGVC